VARTFVDLVNEAMARKHTPDGQPWSDYTLSSAIGLLPGDKSFNAKQVWRLRRGERQQLNHELVGRLIVVLDLDPHEAWPASGLAPPQLTPEHLRQLELFTRRPTEPALTRVGGSDTPPAPSLRPVHRAPATTQGRRGNSCYRVLAGHRRRLLGPAHIGQRVAA
jgi:hypothetical protein